jgi:hypothetical protein
VVTYGFSKDTEPVVFDLTVPLITDKIDGSDSHDILIGDFAIVLLDEQADYLYGILSIQSQSCVKGDGINNITGGDGHDIILGKDDGKPLVDDGNKLGICIVLKIVFNQLTLSLLGGGQIDMIDAGPGSDLASGDCAVILFDDTDFHIKSISWVDQDVGGADEIRMGLGKVQKAKCSMMSSVSNLDLGHL